ncbi:MAG: PfkB family carbohydrate kinase [Deltaproteobacteria bacterium]|jgi:D-beta-D-heptose 7-phosphate kinase/D-beta-D-heptose 1-phosphate adenosyltransferase|nr:PfkB family carbohydrate kinase [Deltaproteobacteria bacterium]
MLEDAKDLLDKIKGKRILCAGDLMLDLYVRGEAPRLSPEAPVPLVMVRDKTYSPGGLGNVIANLRALGAEVLGCVLLGTDAGAEKLKTLLKTSLSPDSPGFVLDPGRPTSVKTRVIAGIQQVVRFDEEPGGRVSEETGKKYEKALEEALPKAGALALSDYGKGLLTPEILSFALGRAAELGIPSIVDPKGRDYERYRGAFLVTPNRGELSLALGRDLTKAPEEELTEGALELMEKHGIRNVLVTRSEDGMTLAESEGPVSHFPAAARAVFDVTGAGDTVVAAVAAALSAGEPLRRAAALATVASGIVVGKVGTASATPGEILESVEILKVKNRSR